MTHPRRPIASLVLLAAVLAGGTGSSIADDKTMEDYMKLLTPELRTRIERARVDFDHWPDPRGKAAAEQILDVGEAAIPFLSVDLQEGSAKAKACAAYVAGHLEARILFDDIVEASRNEQCRPYLRDFFRAMVRLDRGRSVEPLIEWLWEKDTGVRHIAYTFLDTMVDRSMIARLSAVLSSPREGTREYAIRLLGHIDDPAIFEPIVAHLGDTSADVAREASDALSAHHDPALLALLEEAFGDVRDRTAGFACRTMVLIEDRHGVQCFKEGHVDKLISWTRQPDLRFLRAMGTIGLINLGFQVDIQRVTDFLDRWAVPFLIDTVGGGVFFDEYRAVRDLCFAKLNQVSGANLGLRVADWKTWWVEHRATFKAVRGLREVSGIDVRRMEVRYETDEGGVARSAWYFSVGTRWGAIGSDEESTPIVLSEEEMTEVLQALRAMRFFELEGNLGQETERGHTVRFDVRVDNLLRTLRVHGVEKRFIEPVVFLLENLVERHVWQRYWDKGTFPDWARWYQTYEPFWRQVNDPLERNRRMKTMIVTSYQFLEPKKRLEASKHLLRLFDQDAELSDSSQTILAAYLKAEPGLTPTAENLIRCLAASKLMSPIRSCLEFLLEVGGPEARSLINHVLEQGGGAVCAYMLREDDGTLRAAACEVMWAFDDPEIDGLLRDMFEHDTSPSVRRSAAFGLGKRGKPVAIPVLEAVVENPDEDAELKKSALVALGRIGTEHCLSALIGALADDDLRTAAVRGLGASGRLEAVSPIFAFLEKATDPVLIKVAVDALLEIGGPEVVARFRKLSQMADRADLRLAALRALGQLEFEERPEVLQSGLEDPDPDVVLESALQLARGGDGSAIPVLIQALGRGQRTLACETELAALTFQGAEGDGAFARAGFYSVWWEENHKVNRRVWLITALRKKGYPVDTLVQYASGNLDDTGGVPVLIAALYDDEWYLAGGASQALRAISGRTDLPLLDSNSSPEERAEAHLMWRAWWKGRQGR